MLVKVARQVPLERILAVLLQTSLSPDQQVMHFSEGPIGREAKARSFRTRSMKDQRMQTVVGDVDVQIRKGLLVSHQISRPKKVVDRCCLER